DRRIRGEAEVGDEGVLRFVLAPERGEVRAAVKRDHRQKLGAVRCVSRLTAVLVEQFKIGQRAFVVACYELIFGALEKLRQRRIGGEYAAGDEKEECCTQPLKRFHGSPGKA